MEDHGLDNLPSVKHFRTNSDGKHPHLSNPLLDHLFNHPNIETTGPLKELVLQLCANPNDFSILLPSTKFLTTHIDKKSNRPYTEVCKELNFVLSHIVRVNVMKEPRIRTHREFSTLNNFKVTIRSNRILTLPNYTPPIDVKITGQQFIRGFADYIPIGTCFHIVHITECIYNGYTSTDVGTNLLISENIPILPKLETSKVSNYSQKQSVAFEVLLAEFSLLSPINDKFKTLFEEYNFEMCKSLHDLDNDFTVMMRRGSGMLNSLDSNSLNILFNKYTSDQLTESVYDYLEKNVHRNFWKRFVQLSDNVEDKQLEITYSKLKWLSLTQVGLPDEILSDRSILNQYLKKSTAAIRLFKRLQTSQSSSAKCKIISGTVEILSRNTTMDADTLIALLIFVISFSRVKDLNNHILYAKKYAYSHSRIEAGLLGYSISSIEVAMKYLQNQEQLKRLIDCSEKNELLWTLLGDVKSTNFENNEAVFESIETLLGPLNFEGVYFPHHHFIRSISLVGESCLTYALKQKSYELIDVLLQYEHIFTLDDILEEINIEGSNMISLALELDHPSTHILADIVLNAMVNEIENYVNQADSDGRTTGHFLYRSSNLISKLGPFVQWNKKDNMGNTPLMVYVRAYDHPRYVSMMKDTFETVKDWYLKTNRKFNHREHIDFKRNSLMHMIRDATVLKMFLETFNELEMNHLNDSNQSPISLAVRYNRLDIVEVLLNDPRVCLSIVDPKMFMSPLDYVKLDRWDESVNREIAKMLEARFIITEYGEDFAIACVRARFEPDHGLCCYFRLLRENNHSDLVVVPFDSVVKILKLLKKENLSIPFDFSKPELWFPKHGYVSMKGNIDSSNKLRINSLINNLNLLIQSLFKNGTLENTNSLQNFLEKPHRTDGLKYQSLDEREVLKNIFVKDFEHKKSAFTSQMTFQRIFVREDDIVSYEGFLDYTIGDLEKYLKILRRLYRRGTLKDVLTKDYDSMKTSIPLLCERFPEYKELYVQDSSSIFLDKLRLLYATSVDLFKTAHDMKSVKIKRWHKLISDLEITGAELKRMIGVNNMEQQDEDTKSERREAIISQISTQIDLLTGKNRDPEQIEHFRNDLLTTVYKGKYGDQSPKDVEGISLEKLLDLGETGIGSWFTEKRKTVYIKKLLTGFLRHRIELVELFIDLRKSYEQLAVFVSRFYEFRGEVFKDALRSYSKGKVDELKRELLAWDLSLHSVHSK
ncbi:hypothetical protein CANINC_000814 [Pichia inconspicua]|uniref:VPS9 domain-containing protein n=1 Tax=Pichia inconspicua TaxID=52247 RepID=A0A4T0X5C4_9ASCO|nr:hypothetical protein CANINC_000814 [[Candida] inconspicua]